MLSEGSRPPRFTLPDTGGKRRDLRAFLGRDRIVVVFQPDRAWIDAVRAGRGAFLERDLTVLVIVPPDSPRAKETSAPPLLFLTDDGSVARAYGARPGAATFYLIGKDGTIKMARRGCPTSRELFGVIDAMPMRRREMRERR